jgi:hypothetical protein
LILWGWLNLYSIYFLYPESRVSQNPSRGINLLNEYNPTQGTLGRPPMNLGIDEADGSPTSFRREQDYPALTSNIWLETMKKLLQAVDR